MKKYASNNSFKCLINILQKELSDVKQQLEEKVSTINEFEGRMLTLENDIKKLKIEVAPDGALSNWSYTLDDTNGTVTLKYYTGSETDVTVYGKYQLNGKVYDTKIVSNINSSSSSSYMFANNKSVKSITFNEGIDTSECTNMRYMFYGCSSLTSLDVSNFDTSNVTAMNSMFNGCTSLISLNLSGWDTFGVTDIQYMFCGCSALTSLDLSNFNTSNVTTMSGVFQDCNSLTEIIGLENFDTSNATWIAYMFSRCLALTSLDLSGWDTSKVISMSGMFNECSGLTELDLRSFNTSKVTYINNMFQNASALTEIKVTTGKWVYKSGCNTTNMFTGCGVSSVTYYPAA